MRRRTRVNDEGEIGGSYSSWYALRPVFVVESTTLLYP